MAPWSLPSPEPLEEAGRSSDVVVVGGGVMGAWTAWFAQAGGGGNGGEVGGGRSVTLIDAWGTGHGRATSGDETRITRASHGSDRMYTRWSRRALELWTRYEREWATELVLRSGVLWFAARDDGWEAASERTLTELGVPVERLTPDDLVRHWPQVSVHDDLAFILHEPEAGAIMARKACLAVVAAFQRAGGRYAVAGVLPGRAEGGRLHEVVDRHGRSWPAETFVFACGPWLPRVFPDVLRDAIRVTKQDVMFVGPPAGDRRFHWRSLPAWCEFDAAYYGIGATDPNGATARCSTPPTASAWWTRNRCASPGNTYAGGSRRWPTSRWWGHGSASTRPRWTGTSSSPDIPASTTCGWWAAAPGTASSTGRGSGSTW
jgi:glycine/D-amino acid oxidase-like deaminating enzyme